MNRKSLLLTACDPCPIPDYNPGPCLPTTPASCPLLNNYCLHLSLVSQIYFCLPKFSTNTYMHDCRLLSAWLSTIACLTVDYCMHECWLLYAWQSTIVCMTVVYCLNDCRLLYACMNVDCCLHDCRLLSAWMLTISCMTVDYCQHDNRLILVYMYSWHCRL